ncbi:MAG: hypothetical protein ACLQMS_18905 [Desulfomonilaceae bacterium]|jgi:hypothetical protein
MIAWKNMIIILTIMMSTLIISQGLAQVAGSQHGPGGYASGIGSQAPQQGDSPNAVNHTPIAPQTGSGSGQPLQPQSQSSAPGWPNYAYPEYNNPYYDGSSPGKMVSGAIDWALSFPSSVWDQFSGYLDSKLFPRSPATYGGKSPQVQPVAPQNPVGEPPNLPPANSYTPNGR